MSNCCTKLIPSATAIALLVNPANPTQADEQTKLTEAAAHKFGLRLHILNASTESELDKVFASVAEQRADALIVGGDPFFTSQRDRLVDLVARHASNGLQSSGVCRGRWPYELC